MFLADSIVKLAECLDAVSLSSKIAEIMVDCRLNYQQTSLCGTTGTSTCALLEISYW